MKNAYETLGVHAQSSDAEIRHAYYAAARTAHPDKGGTDAAFAAVATAYRTIRTAQARAAYRDTLSLRLGPCAQCSGTGARRRQRGFTGAVLAACTRCLGCGFS